MQANKLFKTIVLKHLKCKILLNDIKYIGKAGSNNGAPNIGVAAEDGYFYSWDLVENDWQPLLDQIDNSWIEEV